MNAVTLVGKRKVRVSAAGVREFNRTWPGSKLRDRAYWFEFGADRDLVGHDVPQHDDGPEVAALAGDCEAWLFDGNNPGWTQ